MEQAGLVLSIAYMSSVYMSYIPRIHYRLVRASGGDCDAYGTTEDSVSDPSPELTLS